MDLLSYFLKIDPTTAEIVEIEGPPSFKDEKGNPIKMKVRALSQEKMDEIFDRYTTKTIVRDKKKNPIVVNGEVVVKRERNSSKAVRHIVALALVDPDPSNPKLQEHFGCFELPDMIYKLFPKTEDYNYVINEVLRVCGVSNDMEEDDDIELAKN